MKIAIHDGNGWNKNWIQYVKDNNIPYILVDCYSTDIINVLRTNHVTHLMWHFSHNLPVDIFMARKIIFASQQSGIKVYPDIKSAWHFDDKVSQKYLLECIGAPLVPSHVFYDKNEALKWAKSVEYPKVAKLRGGAGSYNVKLLENNIDANKYIKKMFGKGIKPSPGYLADSKTKLKVAGSVTGVIKRLKKAPGFFKMVHKSKKGFLKEKGYVYFQDFIPNNTCDYRIIVVNCKVYGMKRMVRPGDFRASGAGLYDYNEIDKNIIDIARVVANKLNMLSVAFDFVIDDNNEPLIVEISYGFGTEGSGKIESYWNEHNEKVLGSIDAPYEIIKGFLGSEFS